MPTPGKNPRILVIDGATMHNVDIFIVGEPPRRGEERYTEDAADIMETLRGCLPYQTWRAILRWMTELESSDWLGATGHAPKWLSRKDLKL